MKTLQCVLQIALKAAVIRVLTKALSYTVKTVHVGGSYASDLNPGTSDAPVKTMHQAIQIANRTSQRLPRTMNVLRLRGGPHDAVLIDGGFITRLAIIGDPHTAITKVTINNKVKDMFYLYMANIDVTFDVTVTARHDLKTTVEPTLVCELLKELM